MTAVRLIAVRVVNASNVTATHETATDFRKHSMRSRPQISRFLSAEYRCLVAGRVGAPRRAHPTMRYQRSSATAMSVTAALLENQSTRLARPVRRLTR